MHFAETNSVGKLWMDAVRSRWSLRRAAGESRWQLAMHMVRWVLLFRRQTRWLRLLDARKTTQQAAKTDPRLYERWHRPYISTHFDLDSRRRIVSSHYAFVMRRFPAQLRQRIAQGHGVRMASLCLEGASLVHLHLGKPSRGDDGELSLSLLTQDKEVLASCILTFDRCNSVIIGKIQGAGPHTPFAATSEFMRGSHGLHPKDLLISLVRELAALRGLKRILAVTSSARIGTSPEGIAADKDDAFLREQGGLPAEAGCHELPLSLIPIVCTEGSRSRSEKRQRREAFRQQACKTFAAAFGTDVELRPASVIPMTASDAASTSRSRLPEPSRSASEHGDLLAADLWESRGAT